MAKKLQLVVNNGQSRDIPPLSVKAIRVRDTKSAKRLLSRLIVQIQRSEVMSDTAKDLTYLLNSFIALMKFAAEEDEIKQIINNHIHVYLRQLQFFSDKMFAEIESVVPAEKLDEYKNRFVTAAKKFNEDAKNIRKQILKEIRNKTSLKPKSKNENTDPDQAAAIILNYMRSLPDNVFQKVITEVQREYFL
ncbi:MAG: hypothetical protein M1495_18640 [Bacteroidetes bacterium]|nr:hypothetical protein [Bacteroidota bacterium]